LMNEDKRCRPILFHSDGPNAGDQVYLLPFTFNFYSGLNCLLLYYLALQLHCWML
jgi:hypothetical protein